MEDAMYPMHSVPVRGHSLATQPRVAYAPADRATRIGVGLVRFLAQRWQARRARMHLAELDDRLLADIGIARDDIRVAIGDPRWLPARR